MEFNKEILQAAKETIPRGARKNYVPYWTNTLQKLQEELAEACNMAEMQPSQQNHIALQNTKAKFSLKKR